MMPEIMEDAAYCPTPHGLVNLPSYSTQDHQLRSGTIHSELSQSSIRKMHHRFARMPIWQGYFLN